MEIISGPDYFLQTLINPDSVAFVFCHLIKCVPPFLHKTLESFMKTNDRGEKLPVRTKGCHTVNENNIPYE